MRRAFSDTLARLADENPRITFLTGDLGFQVFEAFKTKHGPRYINVGVAEAQMVCMAAGLAATGWQPVCYSIASFLTNRAYEQIRVSVHYPGLPVILVGAGGGYSYAGSGITHHAVEDFGLMSLMPNMTVVAPGDPEELRMLLPQMFQLKGPSYLRIGAFGEPVITALEPAVLGKWRLIKSGRKLTIVSTGDLLGNVAEACRLLESEGVAPTHYQAHTVKPLDEKVLQKISTESEAVVVVEEHGPVGGLGSAVQLWLAAHRPNLPVIRLGAPDQLALGNPHRKELQHRLGIGAADIAETLRKLWRTPKSAQA